MTKIQINIKIQNFDICPDFVEGSRFTGWNHLDFEIYL